MKRLTIVLVALFSYGIAKPETLQSCDSPVYCQGDLLDTVQRFQIFRDSKTFVDMSQVNSANKTLDNFEKLMNNTNNKPTKEEVETFVEENFVSKGELEDWTPPDFKSNPAFLKSIDDLVVRHFAKMLVSIWLDLGRKVKSEVNEDPDKYSLIPLPNGFIVPGGRFQEVYYWDSYWIIKGLLLSEMTDTARGMLENFLSLVERYGFIPNGSRVYYLNRSQPPLLALMVGLYIENTNDVHWLRQYIDVVEKELKWWLSNRVIDVEKDGVNYTLAHYASESGTPRPESYFEDISTCLSFEDQVDKENCYKDIKSGAESGWDFSTRWFFDAESGTNTNLTGIQTRRVVPVDLNSYLCKAFKVMAQLYTRIGNDKKSYEWQKKSSSWQKSIERVLYDKEDGIWHDYDTVLSKPRKLFFPSNFAPLYCDCYDTAFRKKYGSRAAKYFVDQGINEYQGGIPTSLKQGGEQWDMPNAWPPLQEMVILGLKNTGDSEALKISENFAKRWVDANIIGYINSKKMYEKYDTINSGRYGEGGEYNVQDGFGWTNGVALSIIDIFYRRC
ncbi:trehalase-like [Anoplophora glabripennis]|uniref:trehalase-like n=1 Tax=Anoplophora glabripennis TaxID=217634 RepID=UPI0008738BB0|nr:trehalase-like [Anoplophora glabripennis]XP_018563584.1 trehalase-like [Anoplophora glabripennis]XP_018563585.1 trehalase-like [Anoplophora glabripennis]